MARGKQEKQKTELLVSHEDAEKRIMAQVEKGKAFPDQRAFTFADTVTRVWHDYTSELLRQLFTTEDVVNEFENAIDVSISGYVAILTSIYSRLGLFRENIQTLANDATGDVPIANIQRLIERFHTVARQLRQRHANRPTLDITDEYDVQDLFHSLLQIYFDDIRAEEWTPSYAGTSSRMDFLLKAQKIVVEIKKTRPGLGSKEVGDQLAIDIQRYRAHQDCKTLICFVYDPEERIANHRGLESDLSKEVGEIAVRIYIVPR